MEESDGSYSAKTYTWTTSGLKDSVFKTTNTTNLIITGQYSPSVAKSGTYSVKYLNGTVVKSGSISSSNGSVKSVTIAVDLNQGFTVTCTTPAYDGGSAFKFTASCYLCL